MNEQGKELGQATGSSDGVDQILAAYALPAPFRWEPVTNYPHVYRVAAGSGEPSHYLKCYTGRRIAEVLGEIDVVNRLHAAGMQVAVAVANRSGAWVTPADALAPNGEPRASGSVGSRQPRPPPLSGRANGRKWAKRTMVAYKQPPR